MPVEAEKFNGLYRTLRMYLHRNPGIWPSLGEPWTPAGVYPALKGGTGATTEEICGDADYPKGSAL